MELSPKLQKQANKLKVPVNYLVLVDLINIGYSEADAYTIAYPENAALSAQQNKRARESIVSSPKFKHLLETRTTESAPTRNPDALLDKEQTARLIMQAAMKQPSDSKERIEGLMKFSDLMGYKKDDVENDPTDAITFAFPIKCYQCPLLHTYNQFRKQSGENELRPDEMERVIRLSHDIIQKTTEVGK